MRDLYEAIGAHRNHWTAQGREEYFRLDRLRYERIIEGLRGHFERAVDVGCGSGFLAARLASVADFVVASDLTAVRLGQVRRHVPTAQPLRSDAGSLPLLDGSVQLVVASEVIEHLPDYRPALDEMARVLAPGGTCVVSVPYREEQEFQVCPNCHQPFLLHGHLHTFDRESLRHALSAAGLVPRRIVTLNNAVASRLGRFLATPYPLLKVLDRFFRWTLPHLNRHMIAFAIKRDRIG